MGEKTGKAASSSRKGTKPARDAVFVREFREDLVWLIEKDRKLTLRTLKLVEAVMDDPFGGISKPEPLKFWAPNVWSRRINEEHRLVYLVQDDRISFLQCRYHYG